MRDSDRRRLRRPCRSGMTRRDRRGMTRPGRRGLRELGRWGLRRSGRSLRRFTIRGASLSVKEKQRRQPDDSKEPLYTQTASYITIYLAVCSLRTVMCRPRRWGPSVCCHSLLPSSVSRVGSTPDSTPVSCSVMQECKLFLFPYSYFIVSQHCFLLPRNYYLRLHSSTPHLFPLNINVNPNKLLL